MGRPERASADRSEAGSDPASSGRVSEQKLERGAGGNISRLPAAAGRTDRPRSGGADPRREIIRREDHEREMNSVQLAVQDFAEAPPDRSQRGRPLTCEHIFFRYSRKTDWIINDFSHPFAPGITLI